MSVRGQRDSSSSASELEIDTRQVLAAGLSQQRRSKRNRLQGPYQQPVRDLGGKRVRGRSVTMVFAVEAPWLGRAWPSPLGAIGGNRLGGRLKD